MKYINKETEEVGVEIALLLAAKNIIIETKKEFIIRDQLIGYEVVPVGLRTLGSQHIYAPTQTEVRNMLREVYNIDVVIEPERYKDGINYAVQAEKFDLVKGCISENFVVAGSFGFNDNGEYPTFKLALDKGLLEGIKLID